MYVGYFGTVSLGLVALAHLFILVQMWLLTALSMLFSMVASSPFVTFMLTTITWLIGSSTQEVKQMLICRYPGDTHHENDCKIGLLPVSKSGAV